MGQFEDTVGGSPGTHETSGLLLDQRDLGPTRVVTAVGTVDAHRSSRLSAVLDDIAADPVRGGVVVDMTEVDFIDCDGLKALLVFHSDMQKAGRVWAVAASHAVSRPLTALEVRDLMVCDGTMEAFAYCHANSPVGA